MPFAVNAGPHLQSFILPFINHLPSNESNPIYSLADDANLRFSPPGVSCNHVNFNVSETPLFFISYKQHSFTLHLYVNSADLHITDFISLFDLRSHRHTFSFSYIVLQAKLVFYFKQCLFTPIAQSWNPLRKWILHSCVEWGFICFSSAAWLGSTHGHLTNRWPFLKIQYPIKSGCFAIPSLVLLLWFLCFISSYILDLCPPIPFPNV